MKGFLFLRSFTTNNCPIQGYDYYFYSDQVTIRINPTGPLEPMDTPRVSFVLSVINQMSQYLNKPIYPLNQDNLNAQMEYYGITELTTYVPCGETLNLESSYLKVIKQPSYNQVDLKNFTSFHKNSVILADKEYNPKTKTEFKVFKLLEDYKSELKNYDIHRTKLESKGSNISPYVALGVISFECLLHYARLYDPVGQFIRQVYWILYCKLKDIPPLNKNLEPPKSVENLERWKNGCIINDKPDVCTFINSEIKKLNSGVLISNRSRLILSYYLIVKLDTYWEHGQAYFRKTLIDYHPKINHYNWFAQQKNRFLRHYNLSRQLKLYS